MLENDIPLEHIIKWLNIERGKQDSYIYELEHNIKNLEEEVKKLTQENSRLYNSIEKLVNEFSDNEKLKYIPKSKRNIYKSNAFYRVLLKQYSDLQKRYNKAENEWAETRNKLIYKLNQNGMGNNCES